MKIVLKTNDMFTEETLQLGFHDMKHQGRERWLGAIKAQTFCLQKTSVGTWVPVGDAVSLETNEVSIAVKTTAGNIEKVFSPVNVSPDTEKVPDQGLESKDGDSDTETDSESEDEDDDENDVE